VATSTFSLTDMAPCFRDALIPMSTSEVVPLSIFPMPVEKVPDFTSPAAKSIDEINAMTITYFAELFLRCHHVASKGAVYVYFWSGF